MKISRIYIFSFFLLIFISCNKKDFNYPAGTVGHSSIVYFPAVSIKGDRLIIIQQGGTYTDPGVTATLNGKDVTATPSTTVDPNTPGIYNITYTATNQQGYSASDWRTVVVIGNDVTANDFSGTYLRTATGVTNTWTKTGTGQYIVDNPGGAGVGVGYKVVVVNYEGNKIAIPKQLAADPSGVIGVVSSANETYNATANPVTYSWVFLAGGYGTQLRNFVKQ